MTDVRDILFQNFPRVVGNPRSFFIHTREDLNRFALINSTENDKNFCSICSYDRDYNPVFSDLFFETDEINPVPVRKVVLWFESHNIPWICLHSGGRGFHLHGLFKPESVKSRTVKRFASLILEETDTKELFDPHVSGVLEKLCRIPNTQRLGNGWCVPITRNELFNLNTPEDFKKLCVAPRFIDFNIINRPTIFNFIKEDNIEDIPLQSIETAPHKDTFFLKHILRPCVYKAIISPNPRHDFRVAAVVSMFNHGLNSTQICDVFSKLNWIDFSWDRTRYQIGYIEEKRKNNELMIPYGKKRLRCERKTSCLKCVLNGE